MRERIYTYSAYLTSGTQALEGEGEKGEATSWYQQLAQGGGSNKGSWESQKVGEDAPLAWSAILLDLRWGELTNTQTP